MRWDSRPGRDPQPGDMIIGAFVRARLLGLSLLTLEAHVVVGHDLRHPGSRLAGISQAAGQIVPAAVEGPGLARAEQLLEQGEDTLARSRRRSP